MANKGLGFLAGFAQAHNKSQEKWDNMNMELNKAAKLAAMDEYKDQKKAYDAIKRIVQVNGDLAPTAAKVQGYDWNSLEPNQRSALSKWANDPKNVEKILNLYRPGEAPTEQSYKNYLGTHPFKKKIREGLGMGVQQPYQRARERSILIPKGDRFQIPAPEKEAAGLMNVPAGNRVINEETGRVVLEAEHKPDKPNSVESYLVQHPEMDKNTADYMYRLKHTSKESRKLINFKHPDTGHITAAYEGTERADMLINMDYAKSGELPAITKRGEVDYDNKVIPAISKLNNYIVYAENLPEDHPQATELKAYAKALQGFKDRDEAEGIFTHLATNMIHYEYDMPEREGQTEDQRWNLSLARALQSIDSTSESTLTFDNIPGFSKEPGSVKPGSVGDIGVSPQDSVKAMQIQAMNAVRSQSPSLANILDNKLGMYKLQVRPTGEWQVVSVDGEVAMQGKIGENK